MPLTDQQVRSATPKDKAYRLTDGAGLCIRIHPDGVKRWELRYTKPSTGKPTSKSFGTYPTTSLKEARLKAAELKLLISQGKDPKQLKRAAKQAAEAGIPVEQLFAEWLASTKSEQTERHRKELAAMFKREFMNKFAKRSAGEFTSREIYLHLMSIHKKRPDTARRVAMYLDAFFRWMVVQGLLANNPAAGLLRELPAPAKQHLKAATKPEQFAELVRKVWGYNRCSLPMQIALKFQIMYFQRPSETLRLKWRDVNFIEGTITSRVTKAKKGQEFDVLLPLTQQSRELLLELQHETHSTGWLFYSSGTGKALTLNGLLRALRAAGVTESEATNHGARAAARTLLAERFNVTESHIEHQLAHKPAGGLGRAYNRTEFLDQRRAMLQLWHDYILTCIAQREGL